MPHTRSAKKQIRKDEKRRVHNRAIKRTIKSEVKKAFSIAETGTLDDLKEQYNEAVKKLDKAAAKRIVHPNMAARKKAQLAKLVNKKAAAKSK